MVIKETKYGLGVESSEGLFGTIDVLMPNDSLKFAQQLDESFVFLLSAHISFSPFAGC